MTVSGMSEASTVMRSPSKSGRRIRGLPVAIVLAAMLSLAGVEARQTGSECQAACSYLPPTQSELAYLAGHPTAVLSSWLRLDGREEPILVTIVLLPEEKIYSAQLYLPPDCESRLSMEIREGAIEPFSTSTAGGTCFYRRGFCRRGVARDAISGLGISYTFVPFKLEGRDNPAFAGDLGLLRLEIPASSIAKAPEALLRAAFGEIVAAGNFPSRELYPLMETRFGMPHRMLNDDFAVPIEAYVLPPVHKLSANKHVEDPQRKLDADLKDLARLLATDSGLLSQRERLRRRLVPDSVKLNWSRIDDTDIGSGQNQFVFLTMGPGINYFDGKWLSRTIAMPGPRVVFDPAVVSFADAQIFPSYSIDPPEKGEGRLRAINRFQHETAGSSREAVPMPPERRRDVLRNLADALCRYGLLNDDPSLEVGFTFMDRTFRGNVVNNEIRLLDGILPREWAIGVIVPPGAGTRARALLSEIGYSDESGPGGIPLSDFVYEAPFPTDAGFRQAYLELVCRRVLPVFSGIFRLLRPPGTSGSAVRPGYAVAMKAVERIVGREGIGFLCGQIAAERAARWAEWRDAWSEYREAVFRNRDEATRERMRDRSARLRRMAYRE